MSDQPGRYAHAGLDQQIDRPAYALESDGVIIITFMYTKFRIVIGVCAVAAGLVLAAPAAAQDDRGAVTAKQYGNSATELGRASSGTFADPGDPSAEDSGYVGSLPFTGLDLALMGVAAVSLIAGGVVMYRRGREA